VDSVGIRGLPSPAPATRRTNPYRTTTPADLRADRAVAAGATISGVATQVRLDGDLERIVDRARAQAQARGELVVAPTGVLSAGLSDAARAALSDWVSSGDYDRAVESITADDPDLATQ